MLSQARGVGTGSGGTSFYDTAPTERRRGVLRFGQEVGSQLTPVTV